MVVKNIALTPKGYFRVGLFFISGILLPNLFSIFYLLKIILNLASY
jgi:hypothetical protein